MSHNSHSFTPVRYLQHKNNPDSNLYNDTQTWTASRCQHLLQPIASRIDILKKDLGRFTSAGESNPPCRGKDRTIPVSDITSFDTKNSIRGDDACWRPVRKRIRKTYSTRGKLKNGLDEVLVSANLTNPQQGNQGRKNASLSGKICVPTPVLNRSQRFLTNLPQCLVANSTVTEPIKIKMRRNPQSHYTMRDGNSHLQLAENMRRLKASIAPDHYKIYEGIYNALEALLRITSSGNEQSHVFVASRSCKAQNPPPLSEEGMSSSRSLLSMCLRAVPNYIKEEERRGVLEPETEVYRSAFHAQSISAEAYSDLESLGTSCTGWIHLKTVVRAHGVQFICEAVQQRLIDVRFASALVMLCTHTSSPNEAEAILSSLLMTHKYSHPRSSHCRFLDVQEMLPLVTLENFVRYTGRTTFYHRQMTKIIVNESLPLSWLGTQDCGHLWTCVFRALSIDPCDRDATAFLAASIPLILLATTSKVDERSDTFEIEVLSVLNATISSVLTTLSAMSILHISHSSKILQLLKVISLDFQLGLPKLNSNPAILIAITNIIVDIQPREDVNCMRPFIEALTQTSPINSTSKYLKEDIPNFICAISRCCGRGSSGDGLEHLFLVLERLKTFASLGSAEERVVMQGIIVKSAFTFAQQVSNKKSLEYAQHISKQMQVGNFPGMLSPSIGVIASTVAFRWEDGVGEWVTASPPSLTKGRKSKSFWSDDESDLETPVRPSVKRYKRGVAPPPNPRFVRYGHCLKTRLSDLGPTSLIDENEDLDLPEPE